MLTWNPDIYQTNMELCSNWLKVWKNENWEKGKEKNLRFQRMWTRLPRWKRRRRRRWKYLEKLWGEFKTWYTFCGKSWGTSRHHRFLPRTRLVVGVNSFTSVLQTSGLLFRRNRWKTAEHRAEIGQKKRQSDGTELIKKRSGSVPYVMPSISWR